MKEVDFMRRKKSLEAIKRRLSFAVILAMLLTMLPMEGAVYAAADASITVDTTTCECQ